MTSPSWTFQVRSRPTLRLAGITAICLACSPGTPTMEGGSAANCGDGNKDPDELCDDGNLNPGDGCSPECVLSGMPYDCVDLLVQDDPEDWDTIAALLPLADGSFIAAGQLDASKDKRGWVGRYDHSGARRWLVDTATVDTQLISIAALAGDEQAGVWALGHTRSHPYAAHILGFDLDGNLVWATPIHSEMGVNVRVNDIEVTTTGVWLGGSYATAGLGTKDAWLGLYDPAQGTVRDVLREDYLGYDDTIDVVVRSGEEVAIAATLSTSPHADEDVMLTVQTEIMVAWFNQAGHELRRTMVGPSPDQDLVRYATRLTADASGRWYVGGVLWPINNVGQLQGWSVQVGGPWAWTTPNLGLGGMVGVDDGIVMGTQLLLTDDSNALYQQGWLGELASDGSLRWEFGVVGDDIPNYQHYRHDVLVHDAEGRLRTAGTILTTGSNARVRSCLVSR